MLQPCNCNKTLYEVPTLIYAGAMEAAYYQRKQNNDVRRQTTSFTDIVCTNRRGLRLQQPHLEQIGADRLLAE